MTRRRLLTVLAIALAVPAGAARAERLTDEQIRGLLEDLDRAGQTWKKDLEREDVDKQVITSAERSVSVKAFLKDFEKAVDTAKSRFSSTNVADTEVLAVLRLGSDVEARSRRQGGTPWSSWVPLGAKLEALAGAYGVAWPIQSMDVAGGRVNDAAVVAKLDQLAVAAGRLRTEAEAAAKADKAIDKPSRDSLKASIQLMERLAKDVRSLTKSDRPASREVDQLLAEVGKVEATLTRMSILSRMGAWQAVDASAQVIARAFSKAKP